MNMEKNNISQKKLDVLKELLVDEEHTIEDLKKLVEKAKPYIKIESKSLDRLLGRYKRNQDIAIDKSLHQSALLVQGSAKQRSPYLTGNLRRSITHVIKKGIALVGTNIVYAQVREFNTRRLPQGYLRPAFRKNLNKIKEIFTKNINRVIKN